MRSNPSALGSITILRKHVVGVVADSMDIARGIGERDGEAFF
jgi:hypothetical protein